jgi:hypothetical protein
MSNETMFILGVAIVLAIMLKAGLWYTFHKLKKRDAEWKARREQPR